MTYVHKEVVELLNAAHHREVVRAYGHDACPSLRFLGIEIMSQKSASALKQSCKPILSHDLVVTI
eukprot:CAMPEP_0197711648 /NCGR_PEP_ID=MMETSP1338-20131121/129560_1 /TAXON_ID=43686 ORGANISM="Pelagodinium beii, Strain RCC1491" /NCGR_SAMPLE_ID=MMETSP1338 /ASSEMBLY_ACC=CAM_ASM_000754 /LENGTH=64 /DNA_ID=CAMNT_0043295581 /DNA_START=59 /DNA_END=253 /DNA_ORIENTATION=+